MEKKGGYEGRIGHGGQMAVQAPFQHAAPKDNSRIHTGKDLRATAGGQSGKSGKG